jgi:hypothetical protein
MTGTVQGNYDPVARLVNGRNLQTGTVIVDANSGKILATVDISGNIVDVATVPAPQTLIVSIDSRRTELDRQIVEALNKGLINAAQSAALRKDLQSITSDETANRQSLTYQKALVLGYGLNTVSERLVPISQRTTVIPVIAPQFVTVDGQLVMVDNVTSRRLQLEIRIGDEYTAGRLSSDQVSRLKSDLNYIASLETKYKRDGLLSEAKNRALSIRLDEVQGSLEHDIAIINQKRSGIGLRVN